MRRKMEKVCLVCGATFLSSENDARYCGRRCYAIDRFGSYGKPKRKPKPVKQCPHNTACQCSDMKCDRCGWNPKVAQMRSEEILKKRKEAMGYG